ncbi:MAG: hypothetical protein HQL12_02890 [Candidatus Omnitrophica bacterium]|nr:hypothetical protein [Candidatus Omnitrophota bacterium]
MTAAHAANQRDLVIQQTMDCFSQHLQQSNGITWNDVCDVSGPNLRQHMEIVNQQMDQAQGKPALENTSQDVSVYFQMPQGVSKNFQMPQKESEWVYAITPEISYIRYHEPGLMKESGSMFGINGSYAYHPAVGSPLKTEMTDMYRLEGRFSYGKVDYQGSVQNSADGSSIPDNFNGINDYLMEARILTGKDYIFNNQSILFTPYFGLGYRFLFDALYENKPYGYNQLIQYLYFPVGAEIATKLGDGWSIGADMEYDFFLGGLVDSYLAEVGGTDTSYVQRNGFGLRGSVKLIKKSKRYNFILEPFFRYWSIRASRVEPSEPISINGLSIAFLGEVPPNDSLEIGGKLGIEF